MSSSVARANGLLKLVHPGRKVVIHTMPIAAAEVLKNYPRHSVTRPDIFEYPWIVVKPEAILKLGKVFFIVPNHTIYKLLKAHSKKHQNSPGKNLSTRNIVNRHLQQAQSQNQHSPRKINAGSTPKHSNRDRHVNHSPPTTSCMWQSSQDQGRDSRTRNQNKVWSWPEVMSKTKTAVLRLDDKPAKDTKFSVRSSHTNDKNIIKPVKDSRFEIIRSSDDEESHQSIVSKSITSIFPDLSDDDYYEIEFKHGRKVEPLKSCLRKPNSVRKLLQLNVTFVLPSEDETQQGRFRVSRDQFCRHSYE